MKREFGIVELFTILVVAMLIVITIIIPMMEKERHETENYWRRITNDDNREKQNRISIKKDSVNNHRDRS